MTHVVVELPIGSTSFARSTADLLRLNELTVSAVDTGFVMRIFAPGTWECATVYDTEDGWPLFSVRHGEEVRREVAADPRRV